MSTALLPETEAAPAVVAPAPMDAPVAEPTLAGLPMDVWDKSRRDAYATVVATRLQNAPAAQHPRIITIIGGEERVLLGALADPQFGAAAVTSFTQALNSKLPADYAMPIGEAIRGVVSILHNRINDCKNKILLLEDPQFIAQARSTPPKPNGPYQLPDGKREEMARRMVSEADPAGFEPAIHDQFGAIGHRIGHDALADIFQPDGPLLQPLTEALQRQAPNVPDWVLQQIAASWLVARANPARATAHELAWDGQAYQAAVTRSDTLQAAKLGVLATPPASHAEQVVARKNQILAERV